MATSSAIEARHLAELDERGFTVLRRLLPQVLIDEFETQIATLVAAQLADLCIEPRHEDSFIDLFTVGGGHTARLYELMERMLVLHRMTACIADALGRADFFDRTGITVPLVWPDVRADIPDGVGRLLPIHQDYRSMKCRTAYRIWVPLRPSNEELGTMCAYAGTHRQGPVAHDLSDPLAPTVPADRYADSERVVFDLPAGDGVLIDPLTFHGSVPNRSRRTKFTLMVQIQDLATMINPDEPDYGSWGEAVSVRGRAEAAVGMR